MGVLNQLRSVRYCGVGCTFRKTNVTVVWEESLFPSELRFSSARFRKPNEILIFKRDKQFRELKGSMQIQRGLCQAFDKLSVTEPHS